MTDFTEKLRHYCRNPKCRARLPRPVSNEREAFCTRGCHTSFYRHRCLICEQPIERTSANRKTCKKRRCQLALKSRARSLGRYYPTGNGKLKQKNPDFIESKQPLGDDRDIAWAIAVNRTRIRAPRRVLDAVFGLIPVHQSVLPLLLAA